MALQLPTTAVRHATRRRISNGAGLAFVLTLGLLITALALAWEGHAILTQIDHLRRDLPLATVKLMSELQETRWGQVLSEAWNGSAYPSQGWLFALGRLGGWAVTGAAALGGLVLVAIIAVYVAADPAAYFRLCLTITPAARRRRMRRAITGAVRQLRWWIVARLASMAFIGVLISVGLALLRVPLWGILGMLAGLLSFIPNAGPILSCAPAALLAFADQPRKGIWALLLFAAAHFLEGNFATPLLENKLVKLPPALTLVTQLLLGVTCGALGVAVAAPLLACVSGAVLSMSGVRRNGHDRRAARLSMVQPSCNSVGENVRRRFTGPSATAPDCSNSRSRTFE